LSTDVFIVAAKEMPRQLRLEYAGAVYHVMARGNAEIVTIATWNLNWFPGGNPTSSEAERLIHMSAARKEGEVLMRDSDPSEHSAAASCSSRDP
jgi:hypothetical protein